MKKLLSLFLLLFLTSCGNQTSSSLSSSTIANTTTSTVASTSSTIDNSKYENKIYIEINLSNFKKINCELYPDLAPITVANFINLINQDYYTDTIFHRIIANFMIQTGGYKIVNKKVTPLPTTNTIKGEFSANGVNNDLKHTAGVLSMARTSAYNSASSQFFICSATSTSLDGHYAAFGKVCDQESLNVVYELSYSQTYVLSQGFQDFPKNPISITKINIL